MPWGTWKPTEIRRVARVLDSSMNTVEVVTDLGSGYLKALGNREGEHALACELIGSSLAEWFGLPTLEFTLFDLGVEPVLFLDADETAPIANRRPAKPGPAFLSKSIRAIQWDALPDDLAKLDNPDVIAGLVLFDTWIANPDRHPRRPVDHGISRWLKARPDNVLLEIVPKDRRHLVAMDFTVCLHCHGELRRSYDDRLVRDDGIYGLFEAFEPFVDETRSRAFLDRLRAADLRQHLVEAFDRIPSEWQVDARARDEAQRFLSARAAYLADNFLDNLHRVAPRPAN